jgi:hypothetical protein
MGEKLTVEVWSRKCLDYCEAEQKISHGDPTLVDDVLYQKRYHDWSPSEDNRPYAGHS